MSHDELNNKGEDFLRQRLDEFQFQQNAEHWSKMQQLMGSEAHLQERLNQHSIAFVPSHWDRMAALLDRKKRRPIILWWSAAAAVLVLATGGYYFSGKTNTEQSKDTAVVESPSRHQQATQSTPEAPSSTSPASNQASAFTVLPNAPSTTLETVSNVQEGSHQSNNTGRLANEFVTTDADDAIPPFAPAQEKLNRGNQNYLEQVVAQTEAIAKQTESSRSTSKLLPVANTSKKLSWHGIAGINMSFVSNPVTNPDAFETYSSQSQTSLLRDEKYGTPGFLSPGAVLGFGINYLTSRKSSIEVDLTYRQKTNINLGQTVSGLRQVSTDTFIDSNGQTVFQARRSTDTSTTITRQWHFLELPISFVAHVTPRHHIIGGVKPAFMFASFAERQWSSKEQDALFEGIFPTNPNESPDASNDILYRKNQDGTTSNYDRFSHFDLGVMLGYRYLLSRNLSLDVRYNQGLKDLSRDKWFGKGAHFNSDLQVSLKYGF